MERLKVTPAQRAALKRAAEKSARRRSAVGHSPSEAGQAQVLAMLDSAAAEFLLAKGALAAKGVDVERTELQLIAAIKEFRLEFLSTWLEAESATA